MTEARTFTASKSLHELRFAAISNGKRRFAFPCDASGRVDIDGLAERDRTNYFYARTVVGKELSSPIVTSVATDEAPRSADPLVLVQSGR